MNKRHPHLDIQYPVFVAELGDATVANQAARVSAMFATANNCPWARGSVLLIGKLAPRCGDEDLPCYVPVEGTPESTGKWRPKISVI
jgi:hypothetical protein